MFKSEANDFNIVDATPFDRDPMAELKAACDRNGLKFGFYYSHAFDWGEENGPGNDWDYENPGGDKHLFATRTTKWFDMHPEIAPRIRTYVDEMDDRVNRAYAAWPTRFYLIGLDGKVVYPGGLGPYGFRPAKLFAAIDHYLAGLA